MSDDAAIYTRSRGRASERGIVASLLTINFMLNFHSVRNASTGSICAALRAGNTPATRPIITALTSASTAKKTGVCTGNHCRHITLRQFAGKGLNHQLCGRHLREQRRPMPYLNATALLLRKLCTHSRTAMLCSFANCRASRQHTPMSP
jgi:hypothetical protein